MQRNQRLVSRQASEADRESIQEILFPTSLCVHAPEKADVGARDHAHGEGLDERLEICGHIEIGSNVTKIQHGGQSPEREKHRRALDCYGTIYI